MKELVRRMPAGLEDYSSFLGHGTQGTCMHGEDPPRSTADFGINDEKGADMVRIVGQELVEVEPPNKRHDIKGMATRH